MPDLTIRVDGTPVQVRVEPNAAETLRQRQLAEAARAGAETAETGAQTAQAGAELARDQAADLVLPVNIFVEADLATAQAAGEAAVTEGTYFKAVGTTEGQAQIRERTGGGSDLLYTELTKTRLNSTAGAGEIGTAGGGDAQQALSARALLATEIAAATIPAPMVAFRTEGYSSGGVGVADYAEFDEGSTGANDAYVAAWPLFAFKSANDRYFRNVADRVTPEMAGATSGSTPTQNATAINAALAWAVERNITFVDNVSRTVRGTIAPGGRFKADFGTAQDYRFETDDVAATYTEMEDGASSGTGSYIAFDLAGCNGSSFTGTLKLTALNTSGGSTTRMRAADRALVAENFVAWGASTHPGGTEITGQTLHVFGFGRGFFQQAAAVLSYTRQCFQHVKFQYCLKAMETQSAGTGFDDMHIGVLEHRRCGGTSTIRSTELTVASAFFSGLNGAHNASSDAETETIALTAGNTTGVLSGANAAVVEGAVIAVKGGNLAKDGTTEISFVAAVTGVSGLNVTFEIAPLVNVAAGEMHINPPSFILNTAQAQFGHLYLEETWDLPMGLTGGRAKLTATDLKLSNGHMDCRRNTPILVACNAPGTGGAILHIVMNNAQGETVNGCRAVVGFNKLASSGETNRLAGDIYMRGQVSTKSDGLTGLDPFLGVKNVTGFASGTNRDTSSHGTINFRAHYGDVTYLCRPANDVSATPGVIYFRLYNPRSTDTATNIASSSATVNTDPGKSLGVMVWDTTNNRLMVATAGAPTSPWYVADGSASVTPS